RASSGFINTSDAVPHRPQQRRRAYSTDNHVRLGQVRRPSERLRRERGSQRDPCVACAVRHHKRCGETWSRKTGSKAGRSKMRRSKLRACNMRCRNGASARTKVNTAPEVPPSTRSSYHWGCGGTNEKN